MQSAGMGHLGARESENVVLYVVRRCAARLELDNLAPMLSVEHARALPCNGGEIEQVQFLLGHASVLTSVRYLECKQNLDESVNDRFGLMLLSARPNCVEALNATS